MKQVRTRNHIALSMLLILAVIFTGCQTTQTNSQDTVKLKYYMFGSSASIAQGAPEVYEAANNIIREKIDAEVDFTILDAGQFGQKMPVILASGEQFDLMFTSSWLNNYALNVSKGALLPLDDLLPKYAQEYYNQVEPQYWEAVKINGKIYGAINEQIMARQAAFVFRKDMIDMTGFDITKIDEFSDIDEYFTLLQQYGVSKEEYDFSSSSFTWQYSVEQANGWEPLNTTNIPGAIDTSATENVKVFNQFKTPEFLDFLKIMKKWKDDGIFHMDRLTSQTTAVNPWVVVCEGTYIPVTWKQQCLPAWKIYGVEDIVIQPYGKTVLTSGNVTATLTGVSSTSKHPEKAVEYLNLVNTNKELYNLLCYGIEGRDYEKIGENKMKPLNSPLYQPCTDWAYGCQFNAYLTEEYPDNAWDAQREYNKNAPVSPLLGFNFDTTNVQTEIANCEAISAEYITMSRYGMLDPDKEYLEFIDKLDKAGADRIIAEMQKQVDAFVAEKQK